MEKRQVQLHNEYGVPFCYIQFFKKTPTTPVFSDEIHISIEITKEKNKNYTVALIPATLKLKSKELKDFSNHLQKKFGTGASAKENPTKISISGIMPKELQEEMRNFFNLGINVIFDCNEKKIQVNSSFKILIKLDEDEDHLTVTWDQIGSPRNIEDNFEKDLNEQFKATFTNDSTHKKAIFNIKGISSDDIKKYFNNIYNMTENQIEILQYVPGSEPKYHCELVINEQNPITKMEQTLLNSKNRFYKETAHTILDLYKFQKKRYINKKFHDDLTFERIPNKEGKNKNKWRTQINAMKIFSTDQLAAGFAIKEKDLVHVTYHNTTIKGIINDVDKEKGIVTATFVLASGEKPPGVDTEEEEISEEELERREKERKEKERREYEEFINKNQNDHVFVETAPEEEEVINAKEEQRLIQICEDSKNLLLNDDFDDEKNSRYFDTNDGRYLIYFEVCDSFYEKCALALLCFNNFKSESDQFHKIKKIILSNDNFYDDNKTDKNLNYDEVAVNLTNSEFLTDIDRKNTSLLSKFVIKPTSEQKKCVEMILSNQISVVHGGPGTGKTYSLGLFVYHLLTRTNNEKKRILLCSKSNQAVENMAKFVAPIVRALGKKMIWLAGFNKAFENKSQFEKANEEEKTLLFYQIMKRKTSEAEKYQELQEEKWKYNDRVKEAKKKTDKIPSFPKSKLKDMSKYMNTIEANLVFESDVVCCTIPTSAKWNILSKQFHYIFIDEAQFANEVECLIPLIHQPRKLILLGDSKQLETYANRKIKSKHPNSLKSLYKKLMKKRIPSQSLITQFRMNPSILSFPNNKFYSDSIQNAPNITNKTTIDLPFIQTPIVFVNVPDGHERRRRCGSYINNEECYVIQKIVTDLRVCQISGKEVAVMTPYYSQSLQLNKILAPLKYKGLKVSTISGFQGSERDFVILSLVRTEPVSRELVFEPDKNSLNVALTRARKGLIIVAKFGIFADESINQNPYLIDLCKFYQNSRSIVDADKIELLKHFVQKPVKKPLIIMKPGDVHNIKADPEPQIDNDIDAFDKIIGGGYIDSVEDNDKHEYDYDDDDDENQNTNEYDFDDDDDDNDD